MARARDPSQMIRVTRNNREISSRRRKGGKGMARVRNPSQIRVRTTSKFHHAGGKEERGWPGSVIRVRSESEQPRNFITLEERRKGDGPGP